MKRTAFLILATIAIAATATDIQRRNDREFSAGVQNGTGELTYSTADDGGSAVLRVGTGDYGTLHVSDPYAVHFAPRRKLAADEYAVVLGDGVSTRADGAFVVAENVMAGGEIDRTIEIVSIDDSLPFANCTVEMDDIGGMRRIEVADNKITLRFHCESGFVGGMGSPGHLYVTGIGVWVYTSPRRNATWDAVTQEVMLHDNMGEVPMSNLRKWICNRYDGRTAENWSGYPATNTVRLAGNVVNFNSAGTIAAFFDGAGATNAWHLAAYGTPVLTIRPGLMTRAVGSAFVIAGFDAHGDTSTVYVTADLATPVRIQTCASLENPTWLDAPDQESSYPQTFPVVYKGSTVQCYKITLPQDEEASACFYRAVCSVDGNSPRELRIGSCDLYVDGVKVVWKTVTIGGQQMRILAEE